MKETVAATVAALLLAPGLSEANEWKVDPSHTTAGFAIQHLVIAKVRGEFNKVQATVVLDEKAPERLSVEASIDVASINTRDEKRDEHLRSPDFFDVAKFPQATFKSSRVTRVSRGYKVEGQLTLHGITRPLTLDVVGLDQEVKDPWGNTKRAGTATGVVKRKDFGIVWNKTLDTGALALGDDVQLTIDFELTKVVAPLAK